MKTKLIVCSFLVTINMFLTNDGYCQQGTYVDDHRILKYQKDIFQYLIEKKILEANTPFNKENFDLKIQVIKCLEVYPNAGNGPLLLIRFGREGDHMARFWGILSDNEKYFFYDPDDIGEIDIPALEKIYDPSTISTMLFYCNVFPREEIGFVLKQSLIYNQKLMIIKKALQKERVPSIAEIDSTRSFFENITGIKSEYSYPTRVDYTHWLNWYRKNRERLYWDNKDNKIKLR